MGNRAVIAFTDSNERKPTVAVYMHWNGGPESIYAILDVMKEHGGMVHSASYSAARFTHLACTLLNGDGLSVGLMGFTNITEMASTGEDNGLYVYDIGTATMERYTARGEARAKKATMVAVAAEEVAARQHKYWQDDKIRNGLRAAFKKQEVA